MSSFIRIVIVLHLAVLLCACNMADWSPIKTEPEYLRYPNGHRVQQCDGSGIPLRNGAPERFWERNNLPKGTINFVCKNGKAYLPGQVPKD